MKAISLHQPWATWVALGWKTIETRRHNRFQSLAGERIAIHAAKTFDHSAYEAAKDFLSEYQRNEWFQYRMSQIPFGTIVATAYVRACVQCFEDDGAAALIECRTTRVGLFLRDIQAFRCACEVKGRQGIFEVPL